MNNGFFAGLLGDVARRIAAVSRQVKDRLLRWLHGKTTVKTADVAKVLRTFDNPYCETLATALTQTTGEVITAQAVREFVVGEVTLSSALYRQARATAARVRRIVQDHTRYGHDARKLALDLYEGYGFREAETLVPKVRLPKYMNHAALNADMDALLARIQAAQLKTAPLRAGYLQALDAILADKGQQAIDKALQVAVEERYRYFANRIAQTELARAQNVEIARELMADDGVQVVQVVLSATHPAPDQCDYFALANRYGLGPGCYPKAVTPRPPFHPHCRCYLRQRGDLSAAHAREDPAAARTFLSRLDPKDAARVAGSRAKRDEMLKGTAPETIWNAKRPEAYRIGTVGDVGKRPFDASAINRLLDDPKASPILIATLPSDIKAQLGVSTNQVLLSHYTAHKQQKHPEIRHSDYEWLQALLNDGTRYPDRDLHVTVVQHRGEWYEAVLKATKAGDEVYLQSFHRTNEDRIEKIKRRISGRPPR